MKKNLLFAFVSVMLIICLISCGSSDANPWDNAKYTENTTFGEGAKAVEVEVKVNDNSVTFTINTDAEMLGDALIAHELLSGDQGDYGLYVKVVNGITADYDVDRSYWGFYRNGEYLMTGIDTTPIAGGEHFEIVYTKE